MPLGFHRPINRSKPELTDHTGIGSASPSTAGSVDDLEAVQPRSNNQHQVLRAHGDSQPYIPQGQAQDVDARRSSQIAGDARPQPLSAPYSPRSYPTQGLPSQAGSSVDDLALESRKLQQQGRRNTGGLQQQTQPPIVEQKKEKKGFFGRMKGSSKTAEPSPPSSYSNSSGLSRRLSRKDHPRVQPPQQQSDSLEHQQPSAWGSKGHLPSPLEGAEDDSRIDPYQIQNPEKEDIYSSQGQARNHTIRPVRGDSDPVNHTAHEEAHQQYQAAQQQQPQQPQHQQQRNSPDSTPQNRYPIQTQHGHSRPGSLSANEQVRQLQNPETVSQVSFDSPLGDQREEQRPTSVQSNGQSPTQRQEYQDRSTVQTPRAASQQTTMPPPPASSQPRRTTDPKQGQGEAREGTPGYQQPYRNQPPTPGLTTPGPSYRGGPPQREQFGTGEQGRSTPPPGTTDNSDAFKELSQKYKKVKSLYFDKTAQVEQLQNTLANQRLSQSRTSLDDSEYMTRFQRLDGAITNLAFNIRKDWRIVPYWIAQSVNQDAMKIGKQEMTAVGRACITKFLMDEIFNRSFHPALEPDLSTSLKIIERNIRRFSPALNNQEESDALISKVIQWRLTTLDGLKDVLNSPESEEYRKEFTQMATSNLTAHIINYLQEPPPAGLQDSAHMIVELAVGICANLPLESREISITYPMPGDTVTPSLMKLGENNVPSLENPGAETISEMDSKSSTSGGSGDKDDEKVDPKLRKEKTKSGMLQHMLASNSSSRKGSTTSPGGADEKAKGAEDGSQRVRFSGFVGIEVRGRQVLGKASVWTMA
ncbi:hypothetical protein PVAG01_09576 [Phlyctema vagabunda]|uniref:S-adenosylmethionine-dependent methyltransferase-like protein n=1 Tax=Phlyctema vagabunda TaxID=108571 RepID=A0ABR4P7U4_9HELO